jgi:hypothetical protein
MVVCFVGNVKKIHTATITYLYPVGHVVRAGLVEDQKVD